MSRWTHAAGIIRVEDYGLLGTWQEGEARKENGELDIIAMLGEIPRGSKGPLEVEVWTNPDKHYIVTHTVSIFGDLRDYEDISAIIIWFQTACRKLSVRNAVITVHNEDYIASWTYGMDDFWEEEEM